MTSAQKRPKAGSVRKKKLIETDEGQAVKRLVESRTQESQRLLQRDREQALSRLEGSDPIVYGFRIRCRACLAEEQANLPGHAQTFMEKHRACERRPTL